MTCSQIKNRPAGGAESVYCPFYIRDTGAVIVCEGLTFGRDSVQRFRCAEERNRWLGDVCASPSCLRLCPQACVLNILYDADAPAPEEVLRVFEGEEKRRRKCARTRRRRRAARRRPRQKDAPAQDA